MKGLVMLGVGILIFFGCRLIFTMSFSGVDGVSLVMGLMALVVVLALSYMGVQYIVSKSEQ